MIDGQSITYITKLVTEGGEASLLSEPRPILKSRVRILRADEYGRLWEAAKSDGKVQMDALLLMGMRYVEAQRFHDNPAWFDPRGFIFLPAQAILKAKRKQLERWVKLNPRGQGVIPQFLHGRQLPSWQTWADRLKRWAEDGGIEPTGLGPKTMRKTWESWLMATYPTRIFEICLSQGHTSATSLYHYLNMPFLPEDKEKIKPYVEGFF